jgi:hypothetical protein
MKKTILVLSIILALVITAFAVFSTCAVAQQKVEPQSLVGDWVGEYSLGGTRGAVYMTVKKVDGNTIYASVLVMAQTTAFNGDNEGTLEGSTITWNKSNTWSAFAVSPNSREMSGAILAQYGRTELKLKKTK